MKDLKEKVVEASGYVIECQNPLEISMEEHSATGCFAELVFEHRYHECLSAVMEYSVERWHNTPTQTFESFLIELGLELIEYKEWVKFQKLPDRLRDNFSNLFLENPSLYREYLDF